ncbi:MAG: metallopeptidase family protein [Bacteroidota bacterium]
MEWSRIEFEDVVLQAFEGLPDLFRAKIDNVQFIVEEYPSEEIQKEMRVGKHNLLGLYTGVPLPHRNTWYGTSATVPDVIYLFRKNIEANCSTKSELTERITEVLLHELGHYFGMSEKQVRRALRTT